MFKFPDEKLFQYEMAGDAKGYVTWTQFCKEPLRDRSFTFWEWFYAIIKITKDQLAMAWKEGRIVGFINKNKVSDVLASHPVGTFLLRFSDSELGKLLNFIKKIHLLKKKYKYFRRNYSQCKRSQPIVNVATLDSQRSYCSISCIKNS